MHIQKAFRNFLSSKHHAGAGLGHSQMLQAGGMGARGGGEHGTSTPQRMSLRHSGMSVLMGSPGGGEGEGGQDYAGGGLTGGREGGYMSEKR